MNTTKLKTLLLSAIVLGALSFTAFANTPAALNNDETYFTFQDTAKTVHGKHHGKPAPANQTSNGNDLNNAGSTAAVRHDRTGSNNPYSTGTVKSHEGKQGATGPSGK